MATHRFVRLTAVAVAIPTLLVAQRTVDVRVDRATDLLADVHRPDIAVADGYTYVVWEDSRDPIGHIYFSRSEDGGRTWLADDVRLDVSSTQHFNPPSYPRIAAEGSTVVVVWEGHRGGLQEDIYANVSQDHGQSWLPAAIRLDTGDSPGSAISNLPRVVMRNGTVLVTWLENRNAPTTFGRRLVANRSLDGGATWLASPAVVEGPNGAGFADEPDIVLTDAGHALAVWQDARGPNSTIQNVYFSRSSDGGATWSPDVLIGGVAPAGSEIARQPRLATPNGMDITVVWTDFRNAATSGRDIYRNRSTDGGVTWLGQTALSTAPGDEELPEVAASGDGIYTAWLAEIPAAWPEDALYFARSTDRGASWSAAVSGVELHRAAQFTMLYRPIVLADGPTVVIAYLEDRGPLLPVVTRSVDAGATWLSGAPVSVNPADVNSFEMRCALDGTTCHLVWRDRRNFSPFQGDLYTNIAFGGQPYGTGLAGSGAVEPRLSLLDRPLLGLTAHVELSQGLGAAPAAFWIAFGGTASVSILGGTVLVAGPILAVPTSLDSSGIAVLPLALPSDPTLQGLRLNLQGLVVDPGAPAGVSMTGGLEAWSL